MKAQLKSLALALPCLAHAYSPDFEKNAHTRKPPQEAHLPPQALESINPQYEKVLKAAYVGDLAVVQAFLDKDGKPDAVRNRSGLTALVLAARQNRIEVMKALLKAGADVKDKDGQTAFDLAQSTEMKKILREVTTEKRKNK